MKLYNKDGYFIINGLLGATWCNYYIICGSANAGKTFTICHHMVNSKLNHPDKVKNYWLRLTDKTVNNLLAGGGKIIDPLIKKKFKIEVARDGKDLLYGTMSLLKGKEVFMPEGKLLTAMALSTFYEDKGTALYDKDFEGTYNIVIDEMNRAKNEKNTFDVVDALTEQIENITRNTKCKVNVFCLGNNMQESSAMFKHLKFVPRKAGIYPIKRKNAIVVLLPEHERTQQSVGYKFNPEATRYKSAASDVEDIKKFVVTDCGNPVIAIAIAQKDIFTVCDNNVIRRYKPEVDGHLKIIALLKNSTHEFYMHRANMFRDRILANAFKFTDEIIFYKLREAFYM